MWAFYCQYELWESRCYIIGRIEWKFGSVKNPTPLDEIKNCKILWTLGRVDHTNMPFCSLILMTNTQYRWYNHQSMIKKERKKEIITKIFLKVKSQGKKKLVNQLCMEHKNATWTKITHFIHNKPLVHQYHPA